MATQPVYRIKDWDKHFEKAQTRKCKEMDWVAIPNKHDGKSFRRIMGMPNGTAIYGCWALLLQVASKCPERGTLADEDGPISGEDFALKTGCPEDIYHETIAALLSSGVKWIEVARTVEVTGATEDQTGSTLPARYQHATTVVARPSNVLELQDRTGQDTTGQNNTPSSPKGDVLDVQIPLLLDCEAFRKAWTQWVAYRKQIKKPLKQMTAEKQLEALSQFGPDGAVEKINTAITNGWQGVVFKDNGTRKQEEDLPDYLRRPPIA